MEGWRADALRVYDVGFPERGLLRVCSLLPDSGLTWLARCLQYFIYQNVQAAAAVNFPRVYDDQSALAVYVINKMIKSGAKVFEVTKEAEEGWIQECIGKSLMRKGL
jgi:hypothetical protein